jgi:hypothetical protein
MFIGVDLTHPSPGSPYKHTSIAAVVTNSGSRCSGCRQSALQVNTPILVVKGGGRTSDGCSSRQNSVQGILSWISGSRTGETDCKVDDVISSVGRFCMGFRLPFQ